MKSQPLPATERPTGAETHRSPEALCSRALGLTPITLVRHARLRVLGLGAESQCALCACEGRIAHLSRPIESLTTPAAYRRYVSAIDRLRTDLGFTPDLLAHDLHPSLLSTRYAREGGIQRIAVQHHHAHVVSVMVDRGITGPVVGICCDGLGHGTDGAAWGCEVLFCNETGFERAGHLEYFPLVGGDAAAVENWRPAAALLQQAYGASWQAQAPPSFAGVGDAALDGFEQLSGRAINSPMTSSLGRVFDGVAFLLGVSSRNDSAAQAAVMLERTASNGSGEPYPYQTRMEQEGVLMSMAPITRAIVQDISAGVAVGRISARFHETIARMLSATALLACDRYGVRRVVLAGGCFANKRLLARVTERLEGQRLRALAPRRVPCGDAGLSLGQAVVAAAIHERVLQCA